LENKLNKTIKLVEGYEIHLAQYQVLSGRGMMIDQLVVAAAQPYQRHHSGFAKESTACCRY
jgi:hypothetical protein